jgi:hypothetical protein
MLRAIELSLAWRSALRSLMTGKTVMHPWQRALRQDLHCCGAAQKYDSHILAAMVGINAPALRIATSDLERERERD